MIYLFVALIVVLFIPELILVLAYGLVAVCSLAEFLASRAPKRKKAAKGKKVLR